MRKMTFFLVVVFVICLTACSSNDDSQSSSCYTIRISGVDERNIVYGGIINKPDDSVFTGYSILFDRSDLFDINIFSGDEIDIKILSYQEIPVVGHTTGMAYYFCKVRQCK